MSMQHDTRSGFQASALSGTEGILPLVGLSRLLLLPALLVRSLCCPSYSSFIPTLTKITHSAHTHCCPTTSFTPPSVYSQSACLTQRSLHTPCQLLLRRAQGFL